MSKNVFLLLFVSILFIISCNAYGWMAWDEDAEHRDISKWLIKNWSSDLPFLQPYVRRLEEAGINADQLIDQSNTEANPNTPDNPHWNWSEINSDGDLDTDVDLDKNNLAAIIHAAEDTGFPTHKPGYYWLVDNGATESTLAAIHSYVDSEAHTRGYFNPPTGDGDKITCDDLLVGDYATKIDTYVQAAYDNALGTWLKWGLFQDNMSDDNIRSIIDDSMLAAQRMTVAAVSQFLDAHEVAAPSYVVADWEFNENGGQILCSNKGSITVPLMLGSSTGNTSHDPVWAWGWGGPGLLFEKYSVHNSAIYARNASVWSSYENETLTPSDSYTIEALVRPTTVPLHYGSGDADSQSCILRYYGGGSSFGEYSLKIYKKWITDGMHHTVVHYSVKQNGASTVSDFIYDTQEEDGFTIEPGRWYYIFVYYNANEDKLSIGIRDMVSQYQKVSSERSCGSMESGGSSTSVFYIGTESTSSSSAHCFDGIISRVRISTGRVSHAQKLYNAAYDSGSSTVACWHMDFALNGVVIDDDRYYPSANRNNHLIMVGGWSLDVGFGRKRLLFNGTSAYGSGLYNWPGGNSACVEFSFRPELVSGVRYLVHVADTWGLYQTSTGLVFYIIDTGGTPRNFLVPNLTLEAGDNYHVFAGIFADKNAVVIIDNEPHWFTSPNKMKDNINTKRITIGAKWNGGTNYNSFFNGYLDEVRITK